jgi:putative hydrolase of the HAD superfamily
MKHIKNIIFDLGGVLLDIDVNRTLRSFDQLGVSEEQLKEVYKQPDNFFFLFERGEINADEFRNKFRSLTNNHLTNKQIDNAWSAMVVGFQEEIVELLKYLAKDYKLFLLSNTNEIHVPVYTRQFKKSSGGITFEGIFSKIYYSHIMQLSKPNPAIYSFVLKDSGIDPEESIFIDDLLQNVNVANETGLPAHQLKENDTLKDVLQQYNINCKLWEE